MTSTGEGRSTSITCPPQMCDQIRAFRARHATYSLSYGAAFRADTTSQLCIHANIPILSTVINTVTDTRGANKVRQNNHQNTTVSALNASTSRDCCIAVLWLKAMGISTQKAQNLSDKWAGQVILQCVATRRVPSSAVAADC